MASDQTRARGVGRERILQDDMGAAPVDMVGANRTVRETTTRDVTQVMNIPADRVRWGPIWAGLLAAFFALLVLWLFGVALGLTVANTGAAAGGAINPNAGQYSALWAGISALIAFLIGGYVAGRTAAVHERGWAALNGALVFLLALPILLWLATQGLGAVIGNANGIASGLGINLGQLQGAATGAVHNPTTGQVQQAASAVKTTAWGTLIGLVVGLAASAVGGTIGMRRAARGARAIAAD